MADIARLDIQIKTTGVEQVNKDLDTLISKANTLQKAASEASAKTAQAAKQSSEVVKKSSKETVDAVSTEAAAVKKAEEAKTEAVKKSTSALSAVGESANRASTSLGKATTATEQLNISQNKATRATTYHTQSLLNSTQAVDANSKAMRRWDSSFSLAGIIAANKHILSFSAAVVGLQGVLRTGMEFESIRSGLRAATGGAQEGAAAFQFIKDEAFRLGITITGAAHGFKVFAGSASGSSLTMRQQREIFSSFAEAATVLGLSLDDTAGIFRALGQIASKGTVQMEELKGQLGDRLPRTLELSAKAMNMTTGELTKMIEKGQLLSDKFLPELAKAYREVVAEELPTAVRKAQAEWNNFMSNIALTKNTLAESGLLDIFKDTLQALNNLLQTSQDEIKSWASSFVTVMKVVSSVVGSAISFLIDNFWTLVPAIGSVYAALRVKQLYDFSKGFQFMAEGADATTKAIGGIRGALLALEATANSLKIVNPIALAILAAAGAGLTLKEMLRDKGYAATESDVDFVAQLGLQDKIKKLEAAEKQIQAWSMSSANIGKSFYQEKLKEIEALKKEIAAASDAYNGGKVLRDLLTSNKAEANSLEEIRIAYIALDNQFKAGKKTKEEYYKALEKLNEKAVNTAKLDEKKGFAAKATDDAAKKALEDKLKLLKEWEKEVEKINLKLAQSGQEWAVKEVLEAEAKYKEKLDKFKGVAGAEVKLNEELQAELAEINKKAIDEQLKLEEEANRQRAEWQVKIYEANQKLSEEILALNSQMYGANAIDEVERWYDSQLEWLGALAAQVPMTVEQIEELLAKINQIRDMKLTQQTLSFKIEYSFFKAFEEGLADAIEGAFNGRLSLKKFFDNIKNSLIKTFSDDLANSITSALRGGGTGGSFLSNLAKGMTVLGGAVAPSMVSAGDIETLVGKGIVALNPETNTYTGNGIEIAADGSVTQGSDLVSQALGIANTVGGIKTLYDLVTGSLATSIAQPFSTAAGLLYKSGVISAETAGSISGFGVNFGQGMTFQGAGTTGAAGIAGGALSGGLLGYGVGRLGDKLFGADTYASTTGAIGGALGGAMAMAGANPLTALGVGIASVVLGGLFGKTKKTGSGISFSGTGTAENIGDVAQYYEDFQKKSWFRKKKWTDYDPLTARQKAAIEGIFNTYDYLLAQLGKSEKIFIAAGKYKDQTFADELAKNFISIFTGIPRTIERAVNESGFSSDLLAAVLGVVPEASRTEIINNPVFDDIYQFWVDYAKSINKTVTEAFQQEVGRLIQTERSFTEWMLGFTGKDTELLAYKAQNATKDFEMLAQSMGATDVTIENFVAKMNEAVRANFTPETIAKWEALGSALQAAEEAQHQYTKAIEATNEALKQDMLNQMTAQLNEWVAVVGAFQTAIENITPAASTSLSSFAGLTVTLENYQSIIGGIEKARQNEINLVTAATDARIDALEREKDMLNDIKNLAKSLTFRIYEQANNTDFGFSAELSKVRSAMSRGENVDLGDLTEATNSYITKVKDTSVSKLEYIQEAARLRQEIEDLSVGAPHGTLEAIENAIAREEESLKAALAQIDATALSLLEQYKAQAVAQVTETQRIIDAINAGAKTIADAIAAAKAATQAQTTPASASASAPASAPASATQGKIALASASASAPASATQVQTAPAAYPTGALAKALQDIAGPGGNSAYIWTGTYSGASHTANGVQLVPGAPGYDYNAALPYLLEMVNGSHANGLDYVPFDGYIAELHKGERVQTASEVKNDRTLEELKAEITELKAITIKNTAEMTRMSKIFSRFDDGDALKVRLAG